MRTQTNEPGPRLHDGLACEARNAATAEEPEELFFGELGALETFGAREDFDVARSAARRSARKRYGREMLVADVDERAALRSFHALRSPEAVA